MGNSKIMNWPKFLVPDHQPDRCLVSPSGLIRPLSAAHSKLEVLKVYYIEVVEIINWPKYLEPKHRSDPYFSVKPVMGQIRPSSVTHSKLEVLKVYHIEVMKILNWAKYFVFSPWSEPCFCQPVVVRLIDFHQQHIQNMKCLKFKSHVKHKQRKIYSPRLQST